MNFKWKFSGMFFLFLFIHSIIAQTDRKEQAHKLGMEAVRLMDKGQIDQSIKLLKEAEKLDPDNINYPYEIAYAHYRRKEYKKAIRILEKIKKHKDAYDRVYQLLGNSYDLIGDWKKALEIYDEGLKKFPHSGMMLLEKGNVFWGKQDYNKALAFYEAGIEADPSFPSNYYRAALLYLQSNEKIWGLIYGEIFMNLEPGTGRTAEMSERLFETYKDHIQISGDTSYSVSFNKKLILHAGDTSRAKLPFPIIFETDFMLALASVAPKSITLSTLDKVRAEFIEVYYNFKHHEKYPVVLFDYQKKLKDAGHFEAYNHWIFMKGDEEAFNSWYEKNEAKWNAFVKWFEKNRLIPNNKNKFYVKKYR